MKKIQEYYGYVICACFMIACVVFVIIKGTNIYIQPHDNLEYGIVWMKMLKDNHLFWKFESTVPFLHGIDRNLLYSELRPYTWIYMLLPCFPAYIIAWILKIFISISGFVFLSRTLYRNHSRDNIFALFGLLYGIYPNYPAAAFSFACLPFLMGIFIRYYTHPQKWHSAAFLLIPAFLEFQFHGVFIYAYVSLFFIGQLMIRRRFQLQLLWPPVLLLLGTLIFDWRFFYYFFFHGMETIRTSFVLDFVSIDGVIARIKRGLLYGEYTSGMAHTKVLLRICELYFLYLNVKYIIKRNLKGIVYDYYNYIIMFIGLNCVIYGVARWKYFYRFLSIVPVLKGFNFERAIWFNGFLWCLAACIAVSRVNKQAVMTVIYGFCLLSVVNNNEIYNDINANIRLCKKQMQGNQIEELVSYRQFYSENMFDNIKNEIGYQGGWSAAFGFHPAILNYNGIHTLDGYHSFYPVKYKQKFRELLQPEFEMDEHYRQYYDDWGGRAYLFSDKCEFNAYLGLPEEPVNLNIDMDVFRELGGKYLFSRVKILNYQELGFDEIGQYKDIESYLLSIYVYEIF